MTKAFLSRPVQSFSGKTGRSWRAAALAALPYMLFAVLMGFDRLPAGRYSASFQVEVLLSYAGVVLWSLLALFVLLDSRRRPRRAAPAAEPAPG